MVATRDSDDEQAGVADSSEFFPDSQQTFTRADLAPLLCELGAARAALRSQNERLNLALDVAESGLWDWDPATDQFTWTPQMERLYGVDPGTIDMYDAWRSRVHPDDVVQAEAERDAALRERRPFDLEFRIVLPSGEIRWIYARGCGHYDAAGTLIRVNGINQDITRRKAADAERETYHARLQAQWESTPIGLFFWKAAGDDLTLTEINLAAEHMSRGKAHEFLGMTATQIYPDRPDMLQGFRTCLAAQGIVRLESDYLARGTREVRAIEFTFVYVAPDGVLLQAVDSTEFRRTEENLRFTQTLVDRMRDAAYWAGEDGRFVYVNEAACAMLGYTRDELLALYVYDAVADYSPAKWQAFWDDLEQNGGRRFETRHRHKDGSIVPVEVQTLMVTSGGRTYACAIARDISERKAMDAALRASEAKFSALFELSPVALTITRVEDGAFLDANEEFLQLSGFARAELIGHTALDLRLYAAPAQRDAIIAEVRRTGQVSGWPVTIRTKDGSTSDCLMSVTIEAIDGVPCFLAGIVDLGLLRQAKEALRASEAKFASFFDLSPIAMSITRVDDGRFVAVNTTFEESTGYAWADVAGRTALELNLYADPADRAAMLAEVRRSGAVRVQPIRFRTRAGEVIECLISLNTVPVDGVECYLAGIMNVQQQRSAEAALEARQADMLAMLENTDGSIWSIDRDYRLTACNSVFRRNVHAALGRELAIGESVFEWSDSEVNTEWRAMYDRALAGERLTLDVQRHYAERDNWMEYRFNPIRAGDGAITGVTVFGRDITERKRTRALIEAQLAEISLYYDTAPVGLAVFDTDLRFLRVNESFAAMNGVSVEDHIGRTVAEVVPLLEVQARQLAATILATGEPVTDIEIAGETPADPGVTHTWREHWYPIKRGDGTIIGFNLTAEDITERKRTQALLERSQQNLARAQEIGRLGSWEWDVPNQRLEWSDELYRIFGVDKRFVPSYTAIEAMIHPQDRAYDSAVVQDALARGNKTEFEIRIIRPDGEVRHIYEYVEIERDPSGAARKLFGVVQDITERKVAEEALRHRERTLNEAERIGQSGSWEYDLATDRAIWSDNMYRIFDVEPGSPVDNFFERFHETLIHPDDRERVQHLYNEVTADGQTYDVEYRVIRRDGSIRHIHSIAAVMRDEAGRTQRLLGWVQDITERKQAAAEREQLQAQLAQAQKMETVGRLAGGIAHDFNNLLAVILLRTEMALQAATPATPLHRSLETIQATAQRSASLVQQLLGFARRQTIAPRVVDLNEAVPAMLPILSKLIGEEIEIRWQPGDDLWMVKMDPSQLDQIVTNLCVNARDAIDGIGQIAIATANMTIPHAPAAPGRTIAHGDHVVLSVADTGRGIDPDVLEHIFEPFFTTKGMGKGTGLGLATVEGIVEQNKGHIHVTSTPGVGTTFAVYLPRFAEAAAAPAAPAAVALPRGDGRRVLLLEDELVVLDMASDALHSLGYTVFAFSSPAAALRALQDDSFTVDVLITDVIMPEMNGALLAERVRQRRPAIKTLFISGYPVDYMADRGILPDDANFLPKPFSRQSLAVKVAEVLGALPA